MYGAGLLLSLVLLTPLLPAELREPRRSAAGRYMAVAIATSLDAFVLEGCRALCVVSIPGHNRPSGVSARLQPMCDAYGDVTHVGTMTSPNGIGSPRKTRGYPREGTSRPFAATRFASHTRGGLLPTSCDALRRCASAAKGIGQKCGSHGGAAWHTRCTRCFGENNLLRVDRSSCGVSGAARRRTILRRRHMTRRTRASSKVMPQARFERRSTRDRPAIDGGDAAWIPLQVASSSNRARLGDPRAPGETVNAA